MLSTASFRATTAQLITAKAPNTPNTVKQLDAWVDQLQRTRQNVGALTTRIQRTMNGASDVSGEAVGYAKRTLELVVTTLQGLDGYEGADDKTRERLISEAKEAQQACASAQFWMGVPQGERPTRTLAVRVGAALDWLEALYTDFTDPDAEIEKKLQVQLHAIIKQGEEVKKLAAARQYKQAVDSGLAWVKMLEKLGSKLEELHEEDEWWEESQFFPLWRKNIGLPLMGLRGRQSLHDLLLLVGEEGESHGQRGAEYWLDWLRGLTTTLDGWRIRAYDTSKRYKLFGVPTEPVKKVKPVRAPRTLKQQIEDMVEKQDSSPKTIGRSRYDLWLDEQAEKVVGRGNPKRLLDKDEPVGIIIRPWVTTDRIGKELLEALTDEPPNGAGWSFERVLGNYWMCNTGWAFGVSAETAALQYFDPHDSFDKLARQLAKENKQLYGQLLNMWPGEFSNMEQQHRYWILLPKEVKDKTTGFMYWSFAK